MKQFLKLILGLFAAGGLVCPAALAQHKTTATVSVSGKINLDDNYLVVVNDLRNKKKEIVEVPLSKAGTFNWKSDIKSTGFIRLSVIPKSRNRQLAAVFPLYVQSGSKIQLNLNYSDSTYLTLLPGKLDGNNKALIEYSNFSFLKMRDMFRNRPASVDQIKGSISPYLATADNYIAKFGVKNVEVKQYMDVWAMNNYLNSLFSLPDDLSRNNQGAELPADYYTFSKSPESVYDHDVALLFNETYMNVNQYVSVKDQGSSAHKDAFEQLKLRFKTLDRLFTNKGLITQIVIANLDEFVRKYSFKANANFDEELAKYKELTAFVKDESKRTELVTSFSNLKYTLRGASLPDVAFKDAAGNEVKLKNLAAGKYIYIDLWASWCKPCIAEIPNLHKLENDYKDKNIVFVSISLDADKNDWKNKMAELKLEGHQLELGNSAYDKLMNVSGIPHFLFYDPAGKLIMYKAPRPGTPAIRAVFDEHLSGEKQE